MKQPASLDTRSFGGVRAFLRNLAGQVWYLVVAPSAS
jgi:hypothetical protein